MSSSLSSFGALVLKDDAFPLLSNTIVTQLAITKNGQEAMGFLDFDATESYLKGVTFGKDDIFVTMGAGEAYKIADKVLKLI